MSDLKSSEIFLLKQLAKFSYQYVPNGFTLVSGETSNEYLDCKMALSHPSTFRALGKVIASKLISNAVAIGGLTMGSDPIAMSACLTTGTIRWFAVRKEAKNYGHKKLIEGDVNPGDRVVIVDDVITSGKSTIQAIKVCKAFGLEIVQVLALIDREEQNGLNQIKNVIPSINTSAIFTKKQINQEWQKQQHDQA